MLHVSLSEGSPYSRPVSRAVGRSVGTVGRGRSSSFSSSSSSSSLHFNFRPITGERLRGREKERERGREVFARGVKRRRRSTRFNAEKVVQVRCPLLFAEEKIGESL